MDGKNEFDSHEEMKRTIKGTEDNESSRTTEANGINGALLGRNKREIDRLRKQLDVRDKQLREQEELLTQYTSPPKAPTVTDPTLTPRAPRRQDIAYLERMRQQKAQEIR